MEKKQIPFTKKKIFLLQKGHLNLKEKTIQSKHFSFGSNESAIRLQSIDSYIAGNPYRCTVDLLIKTACFCKEEKIY